MHIDAKTLPDHTLIEGDICIIGAGAAGIKEASTAPESNIVSAAALLACIHTS